MKERDLPIATHSGRITIGGWDIPCHVLKDGKRILSQSAFVEILEIDARGTKLVHRLTRPLEHRTLKNARMDDILADIRHPIEFLNPNGTSAFGYEGELLVEYCRELLKARSQKLLVGELNLRLAQAAESFLLSLSKVGIAALIDEATGFQAIRPHEALQALLDKYIAKELAAWAKRFPDQFYTEMFRLKGWDWEGMEKNRPSIVGRYTNDIVYERMAPGLLDELKRLNPSDDNGARRVKHHQWLTDEIGHPALAQHLYAVITLMRISPNWSRFYDNLQTAFPKKGDNLLLDLDFEE